MSRVKVKAKSWSVSKHTTFNSFWLQPEFRKCWDVFLNLNKMKTKRLSNHMSQYFYNRTKQMFKRRNVTLLSTKLANFKFDACYRSQKSWHGGKKGLKKQEILKRFSWENNICSPPDDVYFREGLVYFSRTIQNHILQLLQQHGFIVEESGCWIGLQSRSFTYREHLAHH